ncbi:hypothetical protein OAQ62_00025 [bacterium]|nr:hypothetical protein [bacterium]
MAISVKTIADKVFNLLKGYGYEVDTYDKEGNVVGDPADAIRFYVDQPDLLITLNVPTEQIRFSVSKNTDETDQLRSQLKKLSKNYLMSLDFRVFGKTLKPSSDKINIAKVSKENKMEEAIKEASLGPVQGSLKTSYQPLDSVKIVVKHSKPVNEEVRGSRSRNISKIFIQANEERFLFPSKNLNGARAMARHIYNGGVMHDSVGESIVNMCRDFGKLKEFIRYVNKKDLVNEENSQYVSLAKEHVENIRTTFKRLSGVKSYANAVESLKDLDVEVVNEVNLEDHFTETHFDDKVSNVHDTLSKLVNKQSAFESFIMNAIESETFENAKSLIRESDIMTFDSPNARLGYQVSQLGQSSTSEKLGGYLSSIGSKLSNGGDLNQFEYRAVKASLLSAQNSGPVMAENKTAEQKYEDFIETFVKAPEPFVQ